MNTEPNQGLLDASIEIAARRKDTLLKLCGAVLKGDLETAQPLARKLMGNTEKPKREPRLALVKGK